MTDYLLDANHLSPLVTVDHPLRKMIFARFQAGDTFAIATPVLSEFLFGIASLPRAEQNLREWQHLQSDFAYYQISPDHAQDAAALRIQLRKRGWQLALFDALSAIIALQNNLVLLTTDKDFDAIPRLLLEIGAFNNRQSGTQLCSKPV